MSKKGKYLELTEDIEAALRQQLNTLENELLELFKKRAKKNGLIVIEAKWSIVRKINASVSFTVINNF